MLSSNLNLKQHLVQVTEERRIPVHLSASVQVHYDPESNRMYLTNTGDIFPLDYYVSGQVSSRSSSPVKEIEGRELSFRDQIKLFRPEFVKAYQCSLSSDALTPNSGATRKEKEVNDTEILRASRYNRETWVPTFVNRLDALDIRTADSNAISGEMHKSGVNIRYLGQVANLSKIPFIREMACIEMVARTAKHFLQARLQTAILHFKSVGATQIDEEMKTYACNVFSLLLTHSEKTARVINLLISSLSKKNWLLVYLKSLIMS